MQTIQLNLELAEINLILEALGQMPFARVHQLIAKIQQQATAQLEEVHGEQKNNSTEFQSKNLRREDHGSKK